MVCEQVREILLDYRERELEPDRQVKVEEHLQLCKWCSEELQRLNVILAAVAALPAPDPWPGFSRRLRARITDRVPNRRKTLGRASKPILHWVGAGLALAGIAAWAFWPVVLQTDFSTLIGPLSSIRTRSEPNQGGILRADEDRQAGASRDRPMQGMAAPAGARNETDETVRLWNPDHLGQKGLEGLVEIASSPDAVVEKFLDRMSR